MTWIYPGDSSCNFACTAGIGREGRRARGLWQQGAPQQPHCSQGPSSSLLCVREIDFQSSLFLSFFLVFLVRSICLSLSASFFLLVYFSLTDLGMQALALPDPAIRRGQSQSLFAHAAAPDSVAVCAFAIRGAFFCAGICKSFSTEYISHLYANGAAKMFSSQFFPCRHQHCEFWDRHWSVWCTMTSLHCGQRRWRRSQHHRRHVRHRPGCSWGGSPYLGLHVASCIGVVTRSASSSISCILLQCGGTWRARAHHVQRWDRAHPLPCLAISLCAPGPSARQNLQARQCGRRVFQNCCLLAALFLYPAI